MGSRQLLRYGRRLAGLAAQSGSENAPSARLASQAMATSGRGFATEATAVLKEQNSHWLGYSLGGVTAAGVVYYLFTHQSHTQANADGKLVAHAPSGHAVHGHLSISEFSLTDHLGQPASSDDILGEFVMFYFGATTNPATNDAMSKLSETVRQIDRKTNMHYLTPVFISVDPKDEPLKLRGFVTKYHQRLIGLSGGDAHKALESAKQFYKESSSSGSTPQMLQGDAESSDEISHLCFLVNPEGELLASFSDDDSVVDVSDSVARHVANYKLHHPMWHGPKAIKARNA